jgi:RHH-type transcriptional regulator, rel operon repressor / antitoxin RelB
MSYMYDMKTLSIRIDDEIKARWEQLAKAHGLNPSQHMRDAIIDRLEELEDYYVVKERLSKPYETIPHEDVVKQLGLNDLADEN